MAREHYLDGAEVKRMAALGCTMSEIAQKFKVSSHVVENAYLADFLAGIAQMKEELRDAQILCGKKNIGNATMLIWLGKQYLGQKEGMREDRSSEIDKFLQHIDQQWSTSQKNNIEALAKQTLASIYGLDPSDPEKATPPT